MMVTLKLLGRLSLSDSKGPLTGQIAQRRRLAFLAILGASPAATVTRDRLVALLWPELDAEGARHRLSDSLHVAGKARCLRIFGRSGRSRPSRLGRWRPCDPLGRSLMQE